MLHWTDTMCDSLHWYELVHAPRFKWLVFYNWFVSTIHFWCLNVGNAGYDVYADDFSVEKSNIIFPYSFLPNE